MAAVHYHAGKFPPAAIDLSRLVPLIGPASAALARFDAIVSAVPNADVLISPLTTQEAVLSSKIEGTQTTINEVLEFEAGKVVTSEKKTADIQEVLNYRTALYGAIDEMQTIPLSQRLIRSAHRVLMSGVRGAGSDPGEYRRQPNWIGPENCRVEDARFVPPPADRLAGTMAAWERYLHGSAPDPLIQLAILHAEFESIHPFMDGNGRLGRLLIPLFLVNKGTLTRPNFYLSAFLERRRAEYYDRLLAVSREDDWTGWCEFFLVAVKEQAIDNSTRAAAILKLYREKIEWLSHSTHSHHAVRAMNWIFKRPIFQTSDFVASSGIPSRTAHRILTIARERRLLRLVQKGGGRRSSILVFSELLNIAEGRKVF